MTRSSVALLVCVCLSTNARAQSVVAAGQSPSSPAAQGGSASSPRIMTALGLEVEERIELDGILDEPAWKRAVPAGDFRQQDPDNGQPATEPTDAMAASVPTIAFSGRSTPFWTVAPATSSR